MPATAPLSPTISEPLTWTQICARYPDQWVCLVDFDRIDPRRFAFRAARVVGHSERRREAVEQSRPWWREYEEVGQHFTGPPDRDRASPPRFVRVDIAWRSMLRSAPGCADAPVIAHPAPAKVTP